MKKYACKVCGYVYDPAEHDNGAFEDLPEELMDKHVARATRFGSWEEMIDFATDIYARKQMQQ